jgi:carboxypeptidase PM20D1
MKKSLKWGALFAASVVLFAGIISVRTALLPDPVHHPTDNPGLQADIQSRLEAVDRNAIAERLAEAIRFKTVSGQPSDEAFVGIHHWLEATYPAIHAAATRLRIDQHGLIYRWPGRGDCPAAGFISHLDVVPVEANTEADWTYPPFAGVVADGFVWGRGAVDTKDNLVMIMEAADRLAARGFTPHCDLYFLFGHDEEIGGRNGAARMAQMLKEQDVRFAWIVDEGGGVGQNLDGATTPSLVSIGVSSQGYMTLQLVATAPGGHSASGNEETAITRLAAALLALHQAPMPARLDGVAERDVVSRSAGGPLPLKVLAANLWLLRPLAEREIHRRSAVGMLRTTMAATVVEGGTQDNVLPQRATALVNTRIHPRSSISDVLAWVEEQLEEHAVEVVVLEPADPPTGPVHPEDPAFRLLAQSVADVIGPVRVVPAFGFGGYDGRYYQSLADAILNFDFTPMDSSDGIHGTDERLDVRYLAEGVVFHELLMERHGAPR